MTFHNSRLTIISLRNSYFPVPTHLNKLCCIFEFFKKVWALGNDVLCTLQSFHVACFKITRDIHVIAREIHVTRYDFETFYNFYSRKA